MHCYEDTNSRHPDWKETFKDLCDPKKCTCDVIEREAVGREYPRFGATSPPGTPNVCSNNYYTIENFANYNSRSVVTKLQNVTLADCCTSCSNMNTIDKTVCGSYTFVPAVDDSEGIPTGPGTCTIHGPTSFSDFGPRAGVVTGYFSGLGLVAFVQKAAGDLSDLMNGTWYSTQRPGQCNSSTDVIGTDCFWREVEQVAQVRESQLLMFLCVGRSVVVDDWSTFRR